LAVVVGLHRGPTVRAGALEHWRGLDALLTALRAHNAGIAVLVAKADRLSRAHCVRNFVRVPPNEKLRLPARAAVATRRADGLKRP
jgi:hypothetical protein